MPQTRQQRGQNFPASVSRDTSQDRSSETEIDGVNLFDYVVDSTLQHDPSNNSFSSSSVTTSSRRGQRSLRVKRYTNDGDEVVGGGMAHDVRLEAAPPNVTHSSFHLMGETPHAYSSSPLGHPHSPSSNHTSRALRTKRYLHHPSTISSESEDLDEDDNDDDNENDDDNREVEETIKQQQSERPSLPQLSPPPPPPTSPPDDIDNKLSIASSTDVWMAKVGEKAKSDDDEDDPAPLRRAPENRNRRQAALLASAAIVQKGQLKRKGEEPRGQQSTTDTTNQNKAVHIKKEDQPPRDPEISDGMRAARLEVLAARKRKLEALAKISSTSLGQLGGKPVGREPRRMISLDMHPEEEVEEEIPPASSIVPPSPGVDMPSEHPSSVHSETKYDARASNARRRRRLLVLLFLLLSGSGIGIYFGIVYGEDEDPDRSSEASMSPPTSASSPIASPIPSPTPLPAPLPSPLLTPLPTRWPTPLPSLRPVAAAPTSAPLAQFPSNNPVITAMPSQPSVTIPAGVDSALFSLLLSEWPALNDSIANALSPQMRALLWLSVDEGLSTYSTQRKKQRYALATFFLSTNGQAWRANDGWLSNTDECQWYTTGVASSQCDQEGLYLSLKLNFNDLEGSIPAELALLSASLTSIDLVRGDGDGTFLSGILPSEIGRLEKLAFLNLQGNKASVISWGRQSKYHLAFLLIVYFLSPARTIDSNRNWVFDGTTTPPAS